MTHSTSSLRDQTSRYHHGGSLRSYAFFVWILAMLAGLVPATAELLREGSVRIDQDDFGHLERIDDGFGAVMAAGDFDCDGRQDVAFGVPDYDTQVPGPASNQGHVIVAYGGSGTTWSFDITFDQDVGFGQAGEDDDAFGAALAVGNFDGTGCDDLAIGVPGEGLAILGDDFPAAGVVHVVYGFQFTGGLSTLGSQTFSRSIAGELVGIAEAGEGLGSALAAGDFNGDGRDDLAIGVSKFDAGAAAEAGSVQVIYGSDSGLDPAEVRPVATIDQGALGGSDEPGDRFGAAMVAADFNGDEVVDLAIVAPGKLVGGSDNAGAVYVLYGGGGGLTGADHLVLHRDTPGVPGQPAQGEQYGDVLAAGDFDGDGRADLAVRAPGNASGAEAKGTGASPREVHVLFGSDAGLGTTDLQLLTASSASPEFGDDSHFAIALAAGDFDADGRDELALGTPYGLVAPAETLLYPPNDAFSKGIEGTGTVGGEVYVVRATPARTFEPQTVLDQGAGVPGEVGNGRFGDGLVAADINGDGTEDLVVGNSKYDSERGSAFLFYGSSELFSDGFETGNASHWSSQAGG